MNSAWSYREKQPAVAPDAFVAAGAQLVGDVTVGSASSIWFNAVLRGDIAPVIIGHHSNIQDNAVCHVGDDAPCVVGNYVTVGHSAILHGCTVRDEVLIGMGAVVMDGVVVGEQSIVGAAALVSKGFHIPPGSLVYGAPARVVSRLGEKERRQLREAAARYCQLAEEYRRQA
jgi:carbonic anhydrase/acetyltransferase-like protein (isoleucine patch superfamily)